MSFPLRCVLYVFLSLKILYTVWLFYNIAVCIYNFGASTPDMMGFEPGALHSQTGALFLNHTSALLCKAWLNSFPPCRHLLLPTSFSGWLSAPLYRPGRTEDILKTPPDYGNNGPQRNENFSGDFILGEGKCSLQRELVSWKDISHSSNNSRPPDRVRLKPR